MLVLSGWQERQ
uniref:Uncharacterized protein n=1 Tax=Panagrolaimus sp. PS1159 TaxID=55785 RepID=A0AC35GR11_9BILA